jgi:hypothetical protein
MRKTPINHIPIVRLDDMYLYDINIIFIYRLYNLRLDGYFCFSFFLIRFLRLEHILSYRRLTRLVVNIL